MATTQSQNNQEAQLEIVVVIMGGALAGELLIGLLLQPLFFALVDIFQQKQL